MYALLADMMVVVHCVYVGYVVLGQVAIWLGWAFKRTWTRNFWFRATHLAAIGFVAFEEGIGMACPLTVWEAQLRELAGEGPRSGTFMGRLFHDLLFVDLPHSAFTWIHVGFAVIVLATFVLYPPKLPGWIRRPNLKTT
jgi:hypothetical protein